MRPTLTPDQRHLLAFVGRSSGSALLDAFLEERALRSLLARAGGASGPTAPHGAPDWMTSYWTVGVPPKTGSLVSYTVTDNTVFLVDPAHSNAPR